MASRLVIDVFCEDSGHETFLRNLIKVLAQSTGVSKPELRVHSARGGHGRADTALKSRQRALRAGSQPRGDALLVLTDPMAICLDLLPVMDMVKACKNNDSLHHFVAELRALLIRHR